MLKMQGWIREHPITSGIIALVIILLLARLIFGGGRDYEYVTAEVTRGEVVRVVSASGTVRALNTTNVGSEVSGQITNVYVDFNTSVTQGQLLAEIDSTRPRARVTQARAQVDLARATLAQAEASIQRSRTEVEVQTREYDRRRQLADKGFVSGAGLDQAQNALVSARAALSTAQAQAQSANAQIAQSSAELESAQLDLARTKITAPSSGVVINKLVEAGTTVAANFQTPNLFEIAADTSRMQVEAAVDEADIGQVREGQGVRFTVDSYPDETFEAKVQQIRKSATETRNSVSYLVILDVDNRSGKLLTGMTANVEIITGRKADVLRVPVSATRFRPRLQDRDVDGQLQGQKAGEKKSQKNRETVWREGDDPFEPVKTDVTVGLAGEDFVEVTKGLSENQKILVSSRDLSGEGSEEDENND
ncbi:MAG: efflux RND transporter periplasmic adaptor subunit [Pseudomonadota bacterium]